MSELAAFAFSEEGKAFARIEERWGRDPAAYLEPLDDVLAHNLRAALLFALAEDDQAEDDLYDEISGAIEQHTAAIDRLRQADLG